MEVDGAKLLRAEGELDGRRYVAVMLELPNACILLVSEERLALGTLALALPPAPRALAPSSAGIMGERHAMLARMLAERLAGLTGKIALVSLRAGGTEAEVGPRAIAMLKKVLEQRGSGHEPTALPGRV